MCCFYINMHLICSMHLSTCFVKMQMELLVQSLEFNLNSIRVATENFSDANKLGQGGFGIVYKVKKNHIYEKEKQSQFELWNWFGGDLNYYITYAMCFQGMLPNGQDIAVKRLSRDLEILDKENQNSKMRSYQQQSFIVEIRLDFQASALKEWKDFSYMSFYLMEALITLYLV